MNVFVLNTKEDILKNEGNRAVLEVNGVPKQPDYKLSSQYLPLCSEQTHSYRFGSTWGRVKWVYCLFKCSRRWVFCVWDTDEFLLFSAPEMRFVSGFLRRDLRTSRKMGKYTVYGLQKTTRTTTTPGTATPRSRCSFECVNGGFIANTL